MGDDNKVFSNEGPFFKFISFCVDLIDKPIVWVRENIVSPNRQEYYWYHKKFRRVPTVDECYTDDVVCLYEAEQQFQRDKRVDKFIVDILKKRYEFCTLENRYDKEECLSMYETFQKAATNFFIKYGELGSEVSAVRCFMKQKNRMAWERRHGPVGSGRKPPVEETWTKKDNKECQK